MMAWRALAITAMMLTATPAMAQARTGADLPTSGKAEVYYSVTPQQVAAVLKRGGFKTKITKDKVKDGAKQTWSITAESKEPFYMWADVRACDADGYPKGCLGINFVATLTLDAEDRANARRTAERYNRENFVGKAYLSEDGKALYFENYLMVEGGVTATNLDENLANFRAGFSALVTIFNELEKAEDA